MFGNLSLQIPELLLGSIEIAISFGSLYFSGYSRLLVLVYFIHEQVLGNPPVPSGGFNLSLICFSSFFRNELLIVLNVKYNYGYVHMKVPHFLLLRKVFTASFFKANF